MYPVRPKKKPLWIRILLVLYKLTFGFVRQVILAFWHSFYHYFLYFFWIPILEIQLPLHLFFLFTFVIKEIDYNVLKGEPPHTPPTIQYYTLQEFWKTYPINTIVFYSYNHDQPEIASSAEKESVKNVMELAVSWLETEKGDTGK